MSDPFSARFPGTCAACGERYPTTTSIRRTDDTYIHADCDEQPTPDPTEEPACSACWLRHPTGECDRD